MPTIAIVGAGPGLGASIARVFGGHGFQAALRNWVLNLGHALTGKGVYAASVAINVFIGAHAPDGVPHAAPDGIARTYWDLHTRRERAEHVVTG